MIKENFVRMVNESIRENADRKAFSDYDGNVSFTYKEVSEKISGFHNLYSKLGVGKNDKIALIGKNSSNWAIAYLSVVTYGAVVVPILPHFSPADVQELVSHSESVILFANNSIFEPINPEKLQFIKTVISLDDFTCLHAKKSDCAEVVKQFADFKPVIQSNVPISFDVPDNKELFAILYTSGTSGFSKGVMLTHNSIAGNMVYARQYMPLVPGDAILSFLPLAHAYGCAIEFLYPFTLGCHITFLGKTPTPKVILEAFGRIKPRLILSVPLIIEKIFKKQIKPVIDKPLMKILMFLPGIKQKILAKINEKLTASFGGNFHEVVIGGAPLNEDVQKFFMKMKFHFTIGYGMTECGPLISYAGWKDFRLHTAGRVVDQLVMKIDSDDPENIVGEILVKGENVMAGYYKNPDATSESIDSDGWLHTGDLGTIDKDGFLYIRGRSKNMILGASGENIYPEEIESRINNWQYVTESLVVERKGKLVALIYPDIDLVEKEKLDEKALNHILDEARKHMNKHLPKIMQISGIQIMPNEFEKTPKRSIKRYLYTNEE